VISDQETNSTLPQTLQPRFPDVVDTALYDIGNAIGAALRLTEGQGVYDEDSGEPLDSDAETEADSLKAQEQLEFLTYTIEGWQRAFVEYVLEAYKEHLYYDASAGFEYHGIDQQQRGDELNGHFEGAYELSLKLVPGLEKAVVMEHGLLDLVREIQEDIPALRTEASKPWRYIPPMLRTSVGEREKNDAVLRANEKLTEKEEILDFLLYHLESRAHAEAYQQSTPAAGPPQNYQVVLYYADQNAEKDDGTIVAQTSTESVAQLRIEDLEFGVRLGPMCPLQEEIDAGTLVVEQIKPN
jgi:uncharacterized protein YlaN (UPF0358 family)